MDEFEEEPNVLTDAGFTREQRDELCLALGRVVFQWTFVEYYTSEIIQALVPVSGRVTSILVAGTPLDAQWDSIDALLDLKGANELRAEFKACRGAIEQLRTKRNAAVHSGWWPGKAEAAEPVALDSRGRKARAAPGFKFHFEGGLPELRHVAKEIERATEDLYVILQGIWVAGLHLS